MSRLTDEEITRRSAAAGTAALEGRNRIAAHLYRELANEIQTDYGQFDPRALAAFEAVARVIHQD
ncbi:hypothetical protein ACIHEI_14265 [Kitasatospora sp. NPDC051984]|uniref:hypothetical protein n=1 Tax=Kitasatospora sp. NPDC051984 TaxID=3364059 RepID=UPI0037C8FCA2